MTTGRNDPCPCGSGAKYKRCCLEKSTPSLSEARASRMMELQPALEERMRSFAEGHLYEEALDEAWDEFTLGHGEIDNDGPELLLFQTWLFYDWRPGRRLERPALPGDGPTFAAAFLEERGRSLDEMEREFIERVCREPHSFYDVLECEPGRRLRLRDIFRGFEVDVWERDASPLAQAGDVIFARVVQLSGYALIVGMGGLPIPPMEKPILIELRRSMKPGDGGITDRTLHENANDLRNTYFAMADRLLNPPLPKLVNTDGDPLEFHTLTFEIDSAEKAFDALKDLAKGHAGVDLLSGARHFRDGRLRSVEIPWSRAGNRTHPDWDNTVLGNLRVDDLRLTIEVNSEKRARKIKKMVESRLGGHAMHSKTVVKPVDAALMEADRRPRRRSARATGRRKVEDLSTRREMRRIVEEFTEKHWLAWPDLPVPALGGRTPAEAVRDPDGREMVEALLMQFERDDRGKPAGEPRFEFNRLRERLGLGTSRPSSP